MPHLRSYTELIRLKTFEERYKYLAVRSRVGVATFAHERPLNQRFYTSRQWRDLRDEVIVRDHMEDLGTPGYPIPGAPIIHHMNPMSVEDIVDDNPDIMNTEYLITTSHITHNAIHYGVEGHLPRSFTERKPGDTDLW